MLAGSLLGLLNHALKGEAWARERLRLFSGQQLELACGSWQGQFHITDDGLLALVHPPLSSASVRIRLPEDAPWRLLGSRENLLADTHLSGNAQFAESLAFVFRHLRWDIEADLAAMFGDIVGHRLHLAGQAFLATGSQTARKLGDNLAEYLGEEARLLLTKPVFDNFRTELDRLADDLQGLEARLPH